MMLVREITEQLRKELALYKQREVYKLNNYTKDIVSSIEIAINLAEIAERNKTKIRKEDEMWFNGAYQVSRNFDEAESKHIGILYDQLVNLVKAYLFLSSS